MFKNAIAAAALLVVAGFAGQAMAQTSTSSFKAKITIQKACDVTTTAPTDLNFGSHLTTDAPPNEATPGTITVNCSKNTPYTIGLRPSSANGGDDNGNGKMSSTTSSDLVPYKLYQDAGRTTLWGNVSGNVLSGTRASGDPVAKTYQVYGKVPSVDFTPASYEDTVAVTLTY